MARYRVIAYYPKEGNPEAKFPDEYDKAKWEGTDLLELRRKAREWIRKKAKSYGASPALGTITEEEIKPAPKPKPVPKPVPKPAPKKYKLQFVVKDKETDKPIENATVEVTLLPSMKKLIKRTGKDGIAVFPDLEERHLYYIVNAEGYEGTYKDITIPEDKEFHEEVVLLSKLKAPQVVVTPAPVTVVTQKPETVVTEFKPLGTLGDILLAPIKALGGFVVTGFKSAIEFLLDGIKGLIPKPEKYIKEIDRELAVKSIDEDWFRTEEYKKLVKELKERLKHSPEGITDWFKETMINTIGKAYDLVLDLTIPDKTPTEEEAIEHARLLTAYYIDFVTLTGVLQVVARAFSFTLLDKLVDIAELVAGVFGFERWSSAVIAPAFSQSVAPVLHRYYAQKYQTAMPGVSDLVRFVVRDVWNPKIVTPAPDKFKEEMRKLGYSDFWSDAYWTAHWIIPSYEQAREMWWRGKISKDEFMDLVHLADYHPGYDYYWEELSQRLPGRIDARWMYEWGQINKEELKVLLRAYGLHVDWLDKVADAYIKNQLRDEINRVRTRLVSMFAKGYLSESELKDELKKLGYREEVINWTIEEAKARQKEEELDEKVKIILTGFKQGHLTEDEARTQLKELKISDEVIERKIKLVLMSKKIEEKERTRDLSKSDILKLFRLGIITESEAKDFLMRLGYDEEEAELLIMSILIKLYEEGRG